MTLYEEKARKEIVKWRDKKKGWLSKAFGFISKPVEWVYEEVFPDALTNTINKAVMGFIEMLKDAAFWTFSDKKIIKKAKGFGLNVNSIHELRSCDMENLDKLAQTYFMSNKIIAALEGAGCGLGGIALIAADIPALFTVSFRAVQQIGSSYGFDMNDPDMAPIVLEVFSASTATSSASKAAALADMRIAAQALAKNWTYKKVAEKTQTGVIVKVLKDRVKDLPKEISKYITKRKLTQLIPVVGAVIGAGFNYWFLSSTCNSAYMLFRELHLNSKSK